MDNQQMQFPAPSRARSPSRNGNKVHYLLMPSLSRKASSASLRASAQVSSSVVQSKPATEPATDTPPAVLSSASSISNVDIRDQILTNDSRSDVNDPEDSGIVSPAEGDFTRDEEAQRQLRDHLRRTLSQQSTYPTPPRYVQHEQVQLPNRTGLAARQYFVLTDAGKPVFTYRNQYPDSSLSAFDEDDTVTVTGLMQAIISVFADNGDKIKFINSGEKRITFLQRPPLYLVCVASVHEPLSVTRLHLEYLYLQIISICTSFQIKKMFQRRANTDLQRLLQGSDSVIKSLIRRIPQDLGIAFSSLICLRLEPSLRNRVSELLVPGSKLKEVLYAIILSGSKVVFKLPQACLVVELRLDLHILLNTLSSPALTSASASASASWLPICLPKYNPDAFTHTFISYLRPKAQLSFICVCGTSDFEAIRNWGECIADKLDTTGATDSLESASQEAAYNVTELGIPGLHHFVYKSKLHLQLTMPEFDERYQTEEDRGRLISLYHLVYDSMHAKSGQAGPLKLHYIKTENESIMGWITQPFELYVVLSVAISKSAAIAAANAVVRWVRGEEQKLFVKDAPVF